MSTGTHFKGPVTSTGGFVGAVTGNVTGDVAGNLSGYVTAVGTTVAATSTGVAIPASKDFATITSAGANNIVILPAPVAGKVVRGANVGATACELRSSAPATIAVNGVTGAAVEAVLAAGASFEATCKSATAWILHNYGATGTMTNPVPD
jgi:hypothetical protein